MAVIFTGADFRTLDPARPHVEALAVRGERIVAAGDRTACLDAVAGSRCTEIDLGGAYVVPGFIDAHIHTVQHARARSAVMLTGAEGLDVALDRVRAFVADHPGDGWVPGGGWDHNQWDPPVQPDRYALDQACPGRPVALASHDGHTMWVNSAALRALGIDRRTPDPPGGETVRDRGGEPTGILRETAATAAKERISEAASDDLAAVLRAALTGLLAAGITSIHDIDGPEALAGFQQLRSSDDLGLRVCHLIAADALPAAIEAGRSTGDGDHWIRTGPVKLFADGALGSHTAAMSQPYADEPANRGIEVTGPARLTELVRIAADAGISAAIHAIGDRAICTGLDVIEAELDRQRPVPTAPTTGPEKPDPTAAVIGAGPRLRYRIEHAQHVSATDVGRFAALGVVASMQPSHCASDAALAARLLGDRPVASYAWRSLLESGAWLAFGSDSPVEDPNPLVGMQAAVTRAPFAGGPALEPSEALTAEQALRAYTTGSAYASGEERDKGALERGRLADFVALSGDPVVLGEREPASLRQLQVQTTVVGGRVRWSR